MIEKIIESIRNHEGEFLCEAIGNEDNTKVVKFCHIIVPPKLNSEIPKVGDINDFYLLAGSLTLYACPESNEAAFYIAHPEEWDSLEENFADWVNMLDEDEDALPCWFESHKVIGEIPASGNYILVVTGGEESGAIYEFEHDGFEFIKIGSSLENFLLNTLDPDPNAFSQIASHMRFISGASDQQWWARELRHNSGKVVRNND